FEEFNEAYYKGLHEIAEKMSGPTADALEAQKFIGVLKELLATTRYRLMDPIADKIGILTADGLGWKTKSGEVFLLPTLSRAAVENTTGIIEISNHTLHEQMDQLKFLGRKDAGRNTCVIKIGGESRRVLVIAPGVLFDRPPEPDFLPKDEEPGVL
ncbi:MAG: hypothetical protein V1897_01235, partial [Pseudomonadota bacterium]